MENTKNNEVDFFSESNYVTNDDGDRERTVVWRQNGQMYSETTIIHKKVPTIATILLTAFVFTIVGAMIASMIFFARFASFKTLADSIIGHDASVTPTAYAQEQTNEVAFATCQLPQLTPPPMRFEGGGSFVDGNPIPDMYASYVSGVVIVNSYSGNPRRASNLIATGTGFVISENGYILTNAHVIEDATDIRITTYDNKTFEASIVGSDVRTDIAVLKTDESGLTVLPVGNSDSVRAGDFVFAIGHPTGDELSFTATFGMVGAVNRSIVIEGVRNSYIQIDAAINPGNSGGPLFDMNGCVIGVNSAKTTIASYDVDGETISAEGLGFALPINFAMETAQKLIADGGILRPGIGISTIAIDDELASLHNIPTGLLVYTVLEGGPGHKAGLYADDILISVDGTPLITNEQLGEYVRSKTVGDKITINYWRDGVYYDCEIVVGNLNDMGNTIHDDAIGGGKYGIR